MSDDYTIGTSDGEVYKNWMDHAVDHSVEQVPGWQKQAPKAWPDTAKSEPELAEEARTAAAGRTKQSVMPEEGRGTGGFEDLWNKHWNVYAKSVENLQQQDVQSWEQGKTWMPPGVQNLMSAYRIPYNVKESIEELPRLFERQGKRMKYFTGDPEMTKHVNELLTDRENPEREKELQELFGAGQISNDHMILMGIGGGAAPAEAGAMRSIGYRMKPKQFGAADHGFDIINEEGHTVGSLSGMYQEHDRTFHVSGLYSYEHKPGAGNFTNTRANIWGPGVTLAGLRAISLEFPEAGWVSGFRISGTRSSAQTLRRTHSNSYQLIEIPQYIKEEANKMREAAKTDPLGEQLKAIAMENIEQQRVAPDPRMSFSTGDSQAPAIPSAENRRFLEQTPWTDHDQAMLEAMNPGLYGPREVQNPNRTRLNNNLQYQFPGYNLPQRADIERGVRRMNEITSQTEYGPTRDQAHVDLWRGIFPDADVRSLDQWRDYARRTGMADDNPFDVIGTEAHRLNRPHVGVAENFVSLGMPDHRYNTAGGWVYDLANTDWDAPELANGSRPAMARHDILDTHFAKGDEKVAAAGLANNERKPYTPRTPSEHAATINEPGMVRDWTARIIDLMQKYKTTDLREIAKKDKIPERDLRAFVKRNEEMFARPETITGRSIRYPEGRVLNADHISQASIEAMQPGERLGFRTSHGRFVMSDRDLFRGIPKTEPPGSIPEGKLRNQIEEDLADERAKKYQRMKELLDEPPNTRRKWTMKVRERKKNLQDNKKP